MGDSYHDTNSEDARFLQCEAMTVTELTRAMEFLHKIFSPTQLETFTLTEVAECCNAGLNALTHREESLRIRPKSVLLDRQLFNVNFDHSTAGNQTIENMLTLYTGMRTQLTRMRQQVQKWGEN